MKEPEFDFRLPRYQRHFPGVIKPRKLFIPFDFEDTSNATEYGPRWYHADYDITIQFLSDRIPPFRLSQGGEYLFGTDDAELFNEKVTLLLSQQ